MFSARELMPRRGILTALGVGAAAAVAALAVVVFTLGQSEERRRGATSPTTPSGIEARATLSPPVALFGDTVRAQVEVLLDKTRVDPDSVRVAGNFSPWEVIGTSVRERRDASKTAYVRTTFVLRCVSGACVPSGQSAPLEFDRARISYVDAGDPSLRQSSIRARWPVLLVYSRFAAANLEDRDVVTAPWRADLLALPATSYRLSPGTLAALLVLGAALAALGAAALVYLAWPRRAPGELPEPEPELPPEPALSALEQALALLEEPMRVDGGADQRRALELVAEELELAEWGDPDLARTARVLAWSEEIPSVDDSSDLAARVRSALPEIYEDCENGDGNVV